MWQPAQGSLSLLLPIKRNRTRSTTLCDFDEVVDLQTVKIIAARKMEQSEVASECCCART